MNQQVEDGEKERDDDECCHVGAEERTTSVYYLPRSDIRTMKRLRNRVKKSDASARGEIPLRFDFAHIMTEGREIKASERGENYRWRDKGSISPVVIIGACSDPLGSLGDRSS